jgi:hypothetical protein
VIADPETKEATDAGAVLALVPLILDSGRPAKANLSIDSGLLDAIDEAAKRLGGTRSAYLSLSPITGQRRWNFKLQNRVRWSGSP